VSRAYNKNFLGRLWAYICFAFSATWAAIFLAGKQDAVIASSPPLFVSLPGYVVSKIKRIPLIFEIRDIWPKFAIEMGILKNPLAIKLSYWLEKFIYRKAELVNVLTPAFKKYLLQEREIHEEKILYIPNGADLDLMRCGPKNNGVRKSYSWEGKFIVLYTGAHGVANDLEQLMEVARMLKDHPHILFLLIGDGMEKRRLMRLAESEDFKNVYFMDPVPKSRIGDFINASDVCTAILHPTFTTTYPNKIFDYMACARPTILPIDGACRELLVDSAGAGIFVDPTDPEDFRDKILYLYDHPEELERMGGKGRTFVETHFDRRALAEEYLEALHLVTDTPAS
jgi:glycosyltransferase involved in cell wall biosynthesis